MDRNAKKLRRRRLKRNLRKLKLPSKIFRAFLFIVGLALVVGLGILTAHMYGSKIVMDGTAMEPSLASNKIVRVNKAAYILSDPKRMDIIVFRVGRSESGSNYIRRVIGLPGETVMIEDGIIYINDEALTYNYNTDVLADGGIAVDGIKLGSDEYFVLADNYNEAEDSRQQSIGNISSSQIIGKIK